MDYEKKFWTTKDTLNYQNYSEKKLLKNNRTIRTFKFKKPFLLKVKNNKIKNKDDIHYVIPLFFVSTNYPKGFYKGITGFKSIFVFNDEDIIEIIK